MQKRFIKGPMLVVISAPSGAGKTTICRSLIKRNRQMSLSISATTRPPGKGEKNGRDYFFISRAQFETNIKQGWFVEWAKVYGQYYGTPRERVERFLASGKVILFDIDTQGGRAIKKRFPHAVTIFIMPPSLAELRRRLKKRRRDSQVEIEKRLARALKEMKMQTKYDYTIINNKLAVALRQAEAILEAESLKSWRMGLELDGR